MFFVVRFLDFSLKIFSNPYSPLTKAHLKKWIIFKFKSFADRFEKRIIFKPHCILFLLNPNVFHKTFYGCMPEKAHNGDWVNTCQIYVRTDTSSW